MYLTGGGKGGNGWVHKRITRPRLLLAQAIKYIKLARGCVECGYHRRPEALDFDHVRGAKVANVCRLAAAERGDEMWEEIEKCEVVCSNCHRVRTVDRIQSKKAARNG